MPVLVLSGDQDLRTPNADAQAVAARFPQASYVQVPGNGHDELGGDVTGCARQALARFIAGRQVGDPCAGLTNLIDPLPVAPTRVSLILTDKRPLSRFADDARIGNGRPRRGRRAPASG